MKRIIFFSAILLLNIHIFSQNTRRVLFLGNSYTDVNNLPQTVADLAISAGDTLIYDSNCPGGYTLQGHSANITSIGKIQSGNWDYVVLQEQSQLPSFPLNQVETEVFPFAKILNDTIKKYNPCSETMFYMTWGRKNGDAANCAVWPPVCTYEGMDSLLRMRYMMMADSNHAIVSPVGVVWRYIRQKYPMLELYQADESHPSAVGTYIAACCFYTSIFRKNPQLISNDLSLNVGDALNIRNAVKIMVYDSLFLWHIGEYIPHSNFSFSNLSNDNIAFLNTSLNADNYNWNFGDGSFSVFQNPTHIYNASGTYLVTLIASHCNMSDTSQQTIFIQPLQLPDNIKNVNISYFPNPINDILTIIGETDEVNIYSVEGILINVGIDKSIECTIIDMSSIASGVYFIKCKKGFQTYQFKIIKK